MADTPWSWRRNRDPFSRFLTDGSSRNCDPFSQILAQAERLITDISADIEQAKPRRRAKRQPRVSTTTHKPQTTTRRKPQAARTKRRVVVVVEATDTETMYEFESDDEPIVEPRGSHKKPRVETKVQDLVNEWTGYSVMPLEIKHGVVTAECAICQQPVKPGERSVTTICQLDHGHADQHTHFFCHDDLTSWEVQCTMCK